LTLKSCLTTTSSQGNIQNLFQSAYRLANSKKTKKRDIKRKGKRSLKSSKSRMTAQIKQKVVKRNGGKPILDGVSVYDLIMPWKLVGQPLPSKSAAKADTIVQ
jgi:hypothetical protein